ncbi:E3 ubiquitin-protein ligase tom1 [Ancistrocladus abbreviatus]
MEEVTMAAAIQVFSRRAMEGLSFHQLRRSSLAVKPLHAATFQLRGALSSPSRVITDFLFRTSLTVQLIRIQLRVPEYGWTTQKVFHLMNFVVNGLRAVVFGLYKKVYRIKPEALEMILMDLPGLLFLSTYTLLVLFWAEIYHQARSLPTDKLRPAYYTVNGIVWFIQIVIWICMRLSRGHAAVGVAKIFFSVISFTAALGFLIYGGRLFFMLRRFPIESRGRQKKLYETLLKDHPGDGLLLDFSEVGCVTGVCCTCFLIRCVVVAVSAFDRDVDIDVMDHPLVNLIYYMVVEIFPSALVLYILRKLPPKRVSDQYHPVSFLADATVLFTYPEISVSLTNTEVCSVVSNKSTVCVNHRAILLASLPRSPSHLNFPA